MNVKKSFGEKVKRFRKQRNLTQEKLAELIDISPRNLSKIEVGECFVKAETLEKLLFALDISLDELFESDHIKSSEELVISINNYISSIKNNRWLLEKIYKILRDLIED